jgi:hypothetical protein
MQTQFPSIVMQHIRPQLSIDRIGGRRGDAAWIEGMLAHPQARYLLLADLRPAVVSDADDRASALRSFATGDLTGIRLDLADVVFLGLAEQDAPVFAVALGAHLLAAFGSVLEGCGPFVELRSLALQGQIPPHGTPPSAAAANAARAPARAKAAGGAIAGPAARCTFRAPTRQ